MAIGSLNDKARCFLVTGGGGFIGSNLSLALLKDGHSVTVMDNLLTGARKNIVDIEDASKGSGRFKFIEADIRDVEACKRAVEGVDIVLHNAALGSVPRSIQDPFTSTAINVVGTLNVLIAAKDAGIKRFVYASSSSVYGDSATLPKKEGDEGSPLSPYAITKVSNELYAKAFERNYGMETIGLRYFNVFGPRQDALSPYAAVIPIFVRKLLANEAPTINGDGETSRDFTYIDNVVDANIKAAFAPKEAAGRAYNIALAGRVTLNELYNAIAKLLGKEGIRPVYGPQRAGDIRHSFADISLARKYLGYDPKVGFEEGLGRCIGWYKDNL
ncbi:MAG: SDR family oxidoreductase [Deltaproteobacteria bacterium]|nr:SDR family oxidoreductase [Deltaproteobacteria bacterium]